MINRWKVEDAYHIKTPSESANHLKMPNKPTRSNTNQAEQPQKMNRGLEFRILESEGLYYLKVCSGKEDAGQLHLGLFFVNAKRRVFNDGIQRNQLQCERVVWKMERAALSLNEIDHSATIVMK